MLSIFGDLDFTELMLDHFYRLLRGFTGFYLVFYELLLTGSRFVSGSIFPFFCFLSIWAPGLPFWREFHTIWSTFERMSSESSSASERNGQRNGSESTEICLFVCLFVCLLKKNQWIRSRVAVWTAPPPIRAVRAVWRPCAATRWRPAREASTRPTPIDRPPIRYRLQHESISGPKIKKKKKKPNLYRVLPSFKVVFPYGLRAFFFTEVEGPWLDSNGCYRVLPSFQVVFPYGLWSWLGCTELTT